MDTPIYSELWNEYRLEAYYLEMESDFMARNPGVL